MDKLVSKERARKTKERHKKAATNSQPRRSFWDRPGFGLAIAVFTWVLCVVGLRVKTLLHYEPTLDFLLPWVSDAVFAMVGLFCVALFLNVVSPSLLQRNSRIALLAFVSLLSAGLATLIQHAAESLQLIPVPIAQFLLPFVLAPLLSTILIGGRAGLAVGIWTSLVIALQWERSLALFLTGFAATSVIAYAARRIRTRTKVMRIALLAGLAQIIGLLGITALNWNHPDVMVVVHQAAASLAGGLLSAIIALLILPIFEHIFAITTDITLLEFSDLGHPLLQRLAIEAPGTYHHSLVVANLAQAAAENIDANALEARVCSYFHDIGKLTKPNFFSENIHMQQNPHDDLPPSMSTLVIIAHVKEGVSLALINKLPKPVLRVIREHHGSSMLKFFHQKAKSQLEFEIESGDNGSGSSKVDEGSFRYQGPRPSTRVSAIICLADGVEAASRSLKKRTPGHIEGLVNDIVRMRLDDGQLDDCQLTMQDLAKAKRAFVFTLTNMLHGRVPYPNDEDKHKQSAKPSAPEKTPHRDTNGVDHDKGTTAE